ncbi:YraN family protein [Aequorivita soesokkakensis]
MVLEIWYFNLMASHNELGKLGEEIAAQYLLKSGYKILRRNFYFDKAEIDIIAQKEEDTVVIVEVKTRNNSYFGDPQDFVTKNKIKLLVKAANEYIVSNDLNVEVRFDIIAVLKNQKEEKLEHFENAFYHF